MMSKPILLLVAVTVALAGCSQSICKRKDNFFRTKCSGVMSYNGDPMCETYIEKCNEGQIAAGEAYVSCLEALPQCSPDAVSQCASMHPSGVNLMCLK